jgi:hypothetical protein
LVVDGVEDWAVENWAAQGVIVIVKGRVGPVVSVGSRSIQQHIHLRSIDMFT